MTEQKTTNLLELDETGTPVVYLLEASKGECGYYTAWAEAIFLTEKDAKQAKDKYDSEHLATEADFAVAKNFEEIERIQDLIYQKNHPCRVLKFKIGEHRIW